jgi:hypothetical protein
MEENKVVHERILEAIRPSRINSAKFENHRSVASSKLFGMNYLVDAEGIEPSTCRLRVAGEAISAENSQLM